VTFALGESGPDRQLTFRSAPTAAGPVGGDVSDAFQHLGDATSSSVVVVGDTVRVAAGTYTENVSLSKALTLLGAQNGVDARGRVVGAPNPAV